MARHGDAHAELQAFAEELRTQNEQLLAAREALEAERRRYRDLFDFAPDAYLITDPRGVIEEANRAAAELLGVEASALAGKPLTVYVDREDLDAMFRWLRRLVSGQQGFLSWEMRLYPRGGEAINVSASVTSVSNDDGGRAKLRWLIRDVTESKEAQQERQELLVQVARERDVVEELARSLVEERDVLQTIMENTRTCLAYLDRGFQVQRMNLACARAWGCTGQDLIECCPFRLHPEEENQVLLARVFETGEAISFRAAACAVRDGVEKEAAYWDWRLMPVKNAHGQVQGVVLSMQEVTADVRAAGERESLLEGTRRQREFLEGLIEAAPLAIGVVRGPEHRFELANSFFLDLPDNENEPMLGRPVAEVFEEAVARGVGRVLDEVYRTGETARLRKFETGVGPGREQTYWDADYIPLRDAEGKVDGVLIVGHDVTEEVVARRQIEALAARDEAILESMTEGLIVFDMAGNVLTMNAAALRLHEFDRVEDVRRHLREYSALFDIYTLEGNPVPVDEWPLGRVLQGESFVDYEVRVVNLHGERAWIASYSGTPVRNREGDVILGIVTARDATEREEALAQLAEERARLKAIVENAPEGIVVADDEARIMLSNPAAERMFVRPVPYGEEYEARALMQIHYPDGTVWDPRDLPLTRSAIDGETHTEVEQIIVWPDGQQRHLLVSTAPIRDDEALVSGAVGVFQDVTDQVAVRDTLRRQNEELRVLTDELEAYDHTVAHDLKNPLAMVTGSADLLNEALKDEAAPGPQRLVRNILEGTRRMNDIVESLLLLTSTRRHEVELATLDMGQIVDDACNTLTPTIVRRDAELLIGSNWPAVRGFAPWVESVWSNYVSNALKYGGEPPRIALGWSALNDDGGSAALEAPVLSHADLESIRSRVRNRESKVLFWVRDWGPGLAEEAKARLFVEFTRLDRPDKLGHGLGLAIVRRIVETLGGEVGVESRVGEGCVFWFTLPSE